MVMRVLRLPTLLLAGAASGTTAVVFPSSAGFLPLSVELLTAYDIILVKSGLYIKLKEVSKERKYVMCSPPSRITKKILAIECLRRVWTITK